MNTPRLTITAIEVATIIRSRRWHNGAEDWSLLEYAGAMAGEAGETANIAKKIKRIDCSMNNISKNTREELLKKLAYEVADTILYGILLINKAGFDAEEILREVFNAKSDEYGFPDFI